MTDRLIITDGPADTAEIAAFEANRREALRRGLFAGGAVLAAATVPALLRAQTAFAQAEDDKEIVEAALELELESVVAYDTMFKSGLLRGPVADIIRLFRDQEQEHANVLHDELEKLGGEAPEEPDPAEIEGLGGLVAESQMLAFAVELENSSIKAYIDAFEKLDDSDLLHRSAQIMANEGQHLVMLRLALGAGPTSLVPSAFETGTDPAPQTGFFGP